MKLGVAAAAAAVAALVATASAGAHANVSPSVVKAKDGQVFTLAVPNEKDNAKTTKVELTPPATFAIDSFAPASGWKRVVAVHGSGEEATVENVTWSGGSVGPGGYAQFQFLAEPQKTGKASFKVRQTYSDGSVVDWTGSESSDTPAPTVDAVSSLGGGGGHPLLSVIALVAAALALVLSSMTLLLRGGRPAV
jgi:uncharacterized protein YcnI